MTPKTEIGSSLGITTKGGQRFLIEPSVDQDFRYDFVDPDENWHASIRLEETDTAARPELIIDVAEEDLEDPVQRNTIRALAGIGLGLMVIDSRGELYHGLAFDDDKNDLRVGEVFRGSHDHQTVHYLGQGAINAAIPEGFLADAA